MIKPKPEGSIWTDDQWRGVCEQGQNILVSAGAGSGKTAVLTERIIEHVKSGIDIRNLVVLTFTNAAAREMRERVHHALQAACKEKPELAVQLEYIDQAQITTFDAYSQFLLKKYHYLLNIDSNFQIIDNVIVRQLKQEIVDQIFEKNYENKNQDLLNICEQMTIMDDQKLRQQVLALMESLSNDMNPYNHEAYIDYQVTDEAINKYLEIIQQNIEQMQMGLSKLQKVIAEEKFLDIAVMMLEHYQELFKAKTYQQIREFVVTTPAFKKRVPNTKHADKESFKEIFKQVKDLYKTIEQMCTYESEEEMLVEMKQAHQLSRVICEFAIEANDQLLARKLQLNAYEFVDISKLVIKILNSNPEVLADLKGEIAEILLDEYQDTNDIQETFISLLANDNVYMVGDIKQAIYGFRNANPRNFAQKYLDYQQNKGGMLIDLNKNFRSREEVLADINTIFDPLMSLKIGGIDYEGKQRLVYGNKMYETKNPLQNHHMDIITYQASEEIKRHEQEARLIAQDIKSKIASNYQVNEKGQLRLAEYRDFAILTSTKTNFGLYKRIFEEYKIPMQVQSTISDDTENEILVITSLFKLLASLEGDFEQQKQMSREYFKFAFLSLGRSYICEFDDYDLSKQIAQSYNLYDVIKNPINREIAEFAEKILDIYQYYQSYDLQACLNYALDKLGIYQNIYKLDSVHNSEAKIRQMLELFAKFSSEHRTLQEIVEYMELLRIKQEKFELEEAKIENDNVVTMMTIHKSKGLEFNVVYFPQMQGKFNQSDLRQSEMYSREFGYIYQTIENYEKKNTILHTVVLNEAKREMISEQIRLYYVALTRAKDKLIILSQAEFSASLPIDKIDEATKMKFQCFMDFLTSAQGNLFDYNLPLMLEHQDLTSQQNSIVTETEKQINREAYVYHELAMKPSELIRSRASMDSFSLIDVKTKANMQLGTEYHEVLETIDFTNELEEQVKAIDPKIQNIARNIASLDQVKGALKTYNEYQFIYQKGDQEIVGIIDLLVEKEDELIIIDYKLDDIHKPEYEKQIQTYAGYLSQKSSKQVSGYLYSLVRNELKEVDLHD